MLRLADDNPTLLKSDSRFRKDIAAMLSGAVDDAQQWKLTLEQAQRRDRALREQGWKHGARSAATSPSPEV